MLYATKTIYYYYLFHNKYILPEYFLQKMRCHFQEDFSVILQHDSKPSINIHSFLREPIQLAQSQKISY